MPAFPIATSWWVAVLPNLFTSIAMACMMIVLWRERRWRDRRLLKKAIVLPREYVRSEPRRVRDMEIGEEAYVDSSAVATSKRSHRVFVDWSAHLSQPPERPMGLFAPLKLRRLERGFSITVRPGDQFRSSSLPWGYYAPVIEIVTGK